MKYCSFQIGRFLFIEIQFESEEMGKQIVRIVLLKTICVLDNDNQKTFLKSNLIPWLLFGGRY